MKFCTIVKPLSVMMLSGWNWTPCDTSAGSVSNKPVEVLLWMLAAPLGAIRIGLYDNPGMRQATLVMPWAC
jgi:hypothetical protein